MSHCRCNKKGIAGTTARLHMRYAILADIHSNLEAFEAVLGLTSKLKIDRYLSAGDIVGYGADPSRCIALAEKTFYACVAGNHDWAVSDLYDPVNLVENAREAVLWTEGVLSWEEIGYLKSLELVWKEAGMTMVHGSLGSKEDFKYLFNIKDAGETFSYLRTPLCLIGHTHVPTIFQLEGYAVRHGKELKARVSEGCKYIVNVGSVGQPRDGDPRASFAVYDEEARTVEIKRVEYDIKKAEGKILSAGLPSDLAYRLSEGR